MSCQYCLQFNKCSFLHILCGFCCPFYLRTDLCLRINLSSSYFIVNIVWSKNDYLLAIMKDFVTFHMIRLAHLEKRRVVV